MRADAVQARRRWRATLAVALVLLLTLAPVSAEASRGYDPMGSPNAIPLRGQGPVVSVADGDTLEVDIGSRIERVRFAGIQATELGNPPECGAVEATVRARQLLLGQRIQLRGLGTTELSQGRPIRHVMRVDPHGTLDVTEQLLYEGHGFWLQFESELTASTRYQIAAEHARAAGRGLWDDTLCGTGPQHGHPIDLWVKWDADGPDTENVNDEYTVIVNRHPSAPLDLSGWRLRDSSQFEYYLPAGAIVPPGERIRVRVGQGLDTATDFHMGRDFPLFGNPSVDLINYDLYDGRGDGAYLLDPLGNTRASFVYPCVIDCTTSLRGKLVIDEVMYDPPGPDHPDDEYVVLRNVSDERVELDGTRLRNPPYSREFLPGTYLDPDETLTVTMGSGTAHRTHQFWGLEAPQLRNVGDVVELATFDERPIDCAEWGNLERRCPPQFEPGWQPPGAGTSRMAPHAFADIPSGVYYDDAVRWLLDAGITQGTSPTTYGSQASVTRAQMAAFLWRAAGEPQPSAGHGFADVPPGVYYDRAVAWLLDNQITGGQTPTTYGPQNPVLRSQMAAFLWRAAGEPQPSAGHGFADVPSGVYYDRAVAWLLDNQITGGRTATTFAPLEPVSRAQMAAFLWRAAGEPDGVAG